MANLCRAKRFRLKIDDKLLYDARQRLKQRLEEKASFSAQEAMALFENREGNIEFIEFV